MSLAMVLTDTQTAQLPKDADQLPKDTDFPKDTDVLSATDLSLFPTRDTDTDMVAIFTTES